MIELILSLLPFMLLWFSIVEPIKRASFLAKRHSLGDPHGYSYNRVRETLGDPDYVENQGNYMTAQWRRHKYSITLGFNNGVSGDGDVYYWKNKAVHSVTGKKAELGIGFGTIRLQGKEEAGAMFFKVEGEKRVMLIDPRTGAPLSRGLSGVNSD